MGLTRMRPKIFMVSDKNRIRQIVSSTSVTQTGGIALNVVSAFKRRRLANSYVEEYFEVYTSSKGRYHVFSFGWILSENGLPDLLEHLQPMT